MCPKFKMFALIYVFAETVLHYFQDIMMHGKFKEQQLFGIETYFCNIVNVSLLKKTSRLRL